MSLDRRRFLLAILAMATTTSAAEADDAPKKRPPLPAAEARPEEIVKNLYDRYLAGVYDYMEDAQRPHYFTKATDQLLQKVFEKSTREEEAGIDYEPLIDGQDGEVKGLSIVTTLNAPPKATVEAHFVSLDDKVTIIFDFLSEKNAWKIDDIRSGQGNSLKAVAKDYLQ